jgi:branched-chain amino acid transport system permease protein
MVGVIIFAVIIPFLVGDYWFSAILIPFMAFTLAAIGLNLLFGYCGQVSLGHAAFMAVGGYTATVLYIHHVPWPVSVFAAGLMTALVGLLFGLPCARLKGFYLLMATFAAQFTLPWVISRVVPLLVPAGLAVAGGDTVYPPVATIFGWEVDSYFERYFVSLAILMVMTVFAMNLVRSRIGRAWVAIRDHDVAANILGFNLARYKLLAFAISSFYAGIAGSLLVFFYYGNAHAGEFSVDLSLLMLAVVILGGMGSIIGNYFGTAVIITVPILLNRFLMALGHLSGIPITSGLVGGVQAIVYGALIIFFLIVEPLGLAKLWKNVKDYFRLWPFAY